MLDDIVNRVYQQPLSSQDSVKLISVIDDLRHASTVDDLEYIRAKQIHQLLPHDVSVFAIGNIQTMAVEKLINMGYPESFLQITLSSDKKGTVAKSSVVDHVIESGFCLAEVNDALLYNPIFEEWAVSAQQHHIKSMLGTIGTRSRSNLISYFCFLNCKTDQSDKHRLIIQTLIPFLETALFKVTDLNAQALAYGISKREQQILSSLYNGMTNKGIAKFLNISEFTVKNHISNILGKLNCANRVQALAVAIASNIIDPLVKI